MPSAWCYILYPVSAALTRFSRMDSIATSYTPSLRSTHDNRATVQSLGQLMTIAYRTAQSGSPYKRPSSRASYKCCTTVLQSLQVLYYHAETLLSALKPLQQQVGLPKSLLQVLYYCAKTPYTYFKTLTISLLLR
ncbi:hypothetical protein T484DRAFT_2515758 [Baffinella frigidus]|nr:hypothetical protein T484DRAFT_2515758 [Cryptophyta sp. CCMP2293]